MQPNTSSFLRQNSGKNRKISWENGRAWRQTKQPGQTTTTTAVAATTVRPWQPPQPVVVPTVRLYWPLAARLWFLRSAAFWCIFLVRWFLPWIVRLGRIGLLLQPLLTWLASILYFLLTIGLTRANMQSKPEQDKTDRNRRSMCINRKIMQINPQIESESF